jgi:hypothetical protein
MGNLALIIAILGAIIYLLTDAVGKYSAVGELGKIAFLCGLLAYLIK